MKIVIKPFSFQFLFVASNRRMLIGLRLPNRPKRPKKGRKKDKVGLTSADYTNPAGNAVIFVKYMNHLILITDTSTVFFCTNFVSAKVVL